MRAALSVTGMDLSIAGTWRNGGGGDIRTLKSQIDLTASTIRATRLTTPLWALVAALLCSDITGVFGHADLVRTLLLPLLVGGVVSACALACFVYAGVAQSPHQAAAWNIRFTLMQIAISAAWGAMPWLLWESGNGINHLFLAAAVLAVVSALLVSRGSNMSMYLASLVPIASLTTIRFLAGDQPTDWVIGVLAPLVAAQMWWTGRPLIRRMEEDSRLRFKVEDLARELEETRDDALRKRFEAETA